VHKFYVQTNPLSEKMLNYKNPPTWFGVFWTIDPGRSYSAVKVC